MIITVFGASKASQELYLEAYNLGRKIGLAKHSLKNGGYGGTMEAAAKGSFEADGEVIGVGIAGHNIDSLARPNNYNTAFITKNNVLDRISEMLNTDLVIVLGGRLGTLEELFIAWMNDVEGSKTPIIIVGMHFRKLIKYMVSNDFIQFDCLKYIYFVDTVEDIQFELNGEILFNTVQVMDSNGRLITYKETFLREEEFDKLA